MGLKYISVLQLHQCINKAVSYFESIICQNDELSWLFTNRLSATRYMKVKRMGITEILRRIWLFSANKIKSSESFSKKPTQLIVEVNSSLRCMIVTQVLTLFSKSWWELQHSLFCHFLLKGSTSLAVCKEPNLHYC